MKNRRLLLTVVVTVLMVIPIVGASADPCPSITGTALFTWGIGPAGVGPAGTGFANLSYDGERLRVPFETTDIDQTDENTFDVYFTFDFPDGEVRIVEHSTVTGRDASAVTFDSTIEVLDGGTGSWTWLGTSNNTVGKAAIRGISGDLCINP